MTGVEEKRKKLLDTLTKLVGRERAEEFIERTDKRIGIGCQAVNDFLDQQSKKQ